MPSDKGPFLVSNSGPPKEFQTPWVVGATPPAFIILYSSLSSSPSTLISLHCPISSSHTKFLLQLWCQIYPIALSPLPLMWLLPLSAFFLVYPTHMSMLCEPMKMCVCLHWKWKHIHTHPQVWVCISEETCLFFWLWLTFLSSDFKFHPFFYNCHGFFVCE